jgi:hypothetical protein
MWVGMGAASPGWKHATVCSSRTEQRSSCDTTCGYLTRIAGQQAHASTFAGTVERQYCGFITERTAAPHRSPGAHPGSFGRDCACEPQTSMPAAVGMDIPRVPALEADRCPSRLQPAEFHRGQQTHVPLPYGSAELGWIHLITGCTYASHLPMTSSGGRRPGQMRPRAVHAL